MKITAPDGWSINTGSSNIIIAILDTGVDGTHPELASKIVPGWNIYNNNSDTSMSMVMVPQWPERLVLPETTDWRGLCLLGMPHNAGSNF